MPAARGNHEPTIDDELVVTRVFNAPRELVFEMWTVSEHFVSWFGPRAAEIPFCRIDPRPSGIIHFCHQFEHGGKVWVKGVFGEVVAPERLVFTLGFVDAEGRPGGHPMIADWPLDPTIETTVLLRETAGGTSMTVRQRVRPTEAATNESVLQERRLARQGWTEVLDRLGEHLELASSQGRHQHAPNGGSLWPS